MHMAARTMDAAPTETEVATWSSWLRVASLIDRALDEGYGDFDSLTTSIINGECHPRLTKDITRNCRAYLDNLSTLDLDTTLSKLAGLKDTTAEYAQTTSVRRLIELRLDEANYYSSFFMLPLRHPNDSSRVHFNHWVQGFNRTGYLVDSVVDLEQDYAHGEISVRPTIFTRATIGQAALREAVQALRLTPPLVIAEAGRVALRHIST